MQEGLVADRGRTSLPIPDRAPVGLTTYDARDPDTEFPPIQPLRPPAGAPNVLLILLDDAGYGAMGTFGGPTSTPTADRLAAGGLTYNRFHVTALCAPSRQCLLTGRNHHAVGMGTITELATSAPGYSSLRPNSAAPLAQILTLNGYSTAQIGKCHEVPVWETSQLGPFSQWPTGGGGFEYFYGFLGAETNWYLPDLYQGTTPVEQPKTPEEGYHFDEDIADHAIEWVRQQKALMPDKPFFLYYAPAVQGPLRRRLGRATRGDLRPPKAAGRHPPGRRADGPPRSDLSVGGGPRRPQGCARQADGGLRRVHGSLRLPDRPGDRRDR
jgi:arylsulfatase A-like enzyme